ncbi:hypothetical protein B0H16DRAFT_1702710 [Mycena metata]|uniref:Uncharacterized protein n=1 Tax=Mycena metata TaxID=1033252 RepID=A0AAD7ME33_9AGAR|nr:hypothetical protein B0H16DRAFT_1702710 [Mycena metata]
MNERINGVLHRARARSPRDLRRIAYGKSPRALYCAARRTQRLGYEALREADGRRTKTAISLRADGLEAKAAEATRAGARARLGKKEEQGVVPWIGFYTSAPFTRSEGDREWQECSGRDAAGDGEQVEGGMDNEDRGRRRWRNAVGRDGEVLKKGTPMARWRKRDALSAAGRFGGVRTMVNSSRGPGLYKAEDPELHQENPKLIIATNSQLFMPPSIVTQLSTIIEQIVGQFSAQKFELKDENLVRGRLRSIIKTYTFNGILVMVAQLQHLTKSPRREENEYEKKDAKEIAHTAQIIGLEGTSGLTRLICHYPPGV